MDSVKQDQKQKTYNAGISSELDSKKNMLIVSILGNMGLDILEEIGASVCLQFTHYC